MKYDALLRCSAGGREGGARIQTCAKSSRGLSSRVGIRAQQFNQVSASPGEYFLIALMNAEVALHLKLARRKKKLEERGQNLVLEEAAADCGPCVFDESDPVSLGNPRSVLTLHLAPAPDRSEEEEEEKDGPVVSFFAFLLCRAAIFCGVFCFQYHLASAA